MGKEYLGTPRSHEKYELLIDVKQRTGRVFEIYEYHIEAGRRTTIVDKDTGEITPPTRRNAA